ncbi:DUF6376 family protein [Fictibacillus aquaticus]|uniref:Lipoprotein n=1 Tax=Fictibacillus aquaticus TaxID=2021314 RepID=A0A235FCE4_9BACL|nr:DUF6376 family protein [Fictibacillus aquaticus]OYD58627.1 hypothetical protein CGZ90_01625 [Fictibacillus aquaticus]
MKKIQVFSFLLIFSLLLMGCQAVSDVKNGIEYVPKATDFVNEVQTFANEVPALAEKAVSDKNAAADLEQKLNDMKSDINDFNDLTPPSMFEDIHSQVIEHNQSFEKGIDTYLENVKNGEISPDLLKQTGLTDEIAQYTDLLDQIKKIGE